MKTAMLQFDFKANPGANMAVLMSLVKESATLWTKSGGDVSFYAVQVGETGQFSFVVRFESAANLGAAMDKLNADPAQAAWRVKAIESGVGTWVRSNQFYEIPLS